MINTSKIEGVPVSKMESIARGIPLVAFDVGGISEILSSVTGLLLDTEDDVNFNIESLKKFIVNYDFDLSKRKEVQKFYEMNYSAAKNYERFCQQVLELP